MPITVGNGELLYNQRRSGLKIVPIFWDVIKHVHGITIFTPNVTFLYIHL